MTAHDLVLDLNRRGVRLSLAAGATRVHVSDPSGRAVTGRDVEALRSLKADVIDLVMEVEERAAVMEVEGGMTREAAERAAWAELTGEATGVTR